MGGDKVAAQPAAAGQHGRLWLAVTTLRADVSAFAWFCVQGFVRSQVWAAGSCRMFSRLWQCCCFAADKLRWQVQAAGQLSVWQIHTIWDADTLYRASCLPACAAGNTWLRHQGFAEAIGPHWSTFVSYIHYDCWRRCSLG